MALRCGIRNTRLFAGFRVVARNYGMRDTFLVENVLVKLRMFNFQLPHLFVCRFVLQVQIYLFLSMVNVPVFYKRVQITTFVGLFLK